MSSKFVKLALFVSLFLLCFISLIPLFLSTNLGTNSLVSFANKKIHGTFQVEDISLSWFGKQNFYKVSLKNSDPEPIVTIKRIEVDASLLSLLMDINNFNRLTIEDASIKITQDNKGITDLQDALGLEKMERGGTRAPVFIENGEIEIALGSSSEVIAKAKGITRQNDITGNFSIDLSFAKNGPQKVNLEASHFPTLVLDQTLAIVNPKLSGLLLSLFGDSLQIVLNKNTNNATNELKLAAKSPFVNIDFSGKINQDAIYLEPNGVLDFNIPQKNGDLIFSKLGLKTLQVKKPLAGRLITGSLSIPLNTDDVQNFSGTGHLSIHPTQIVLGKDQIEVTNLKADIIAAKGSPKMEISISVDGRREMSPLNLNFNLNFPKFALVTSNFDSVMYEGIHLKGNFKNEIPFIDAKWEGILKETYTEIDMAFASNLLTIPKAHVSIPFIPFQEIFEDGEIESVIQGQITGFDPKFDLPISRIDEINIPWILDVKENSLKLNLIAKSLDPELKSTVKGSLRIDDFINETEFDTKLASVQLNLKLDAIQTDALQPFISPYPVKRVFGPALDMEITLAKEGQGALQGCIEIAPPKVSGAFLKRIYSKFEVQKHDITFQTDTQQALGATNFIGTIQNVFDHEGKPDFSKGSFCMQGNLKHFPVGIIAKVLTGDEKIADTMEAILGSQVDGDIRAEMVHRKGPIHIHLKGLNGECDVDARIADKFLLLNKPLTANLKVTPQLEHAVLREYLPILGSVVEAENPIELSIPVEGFRLSLTSPNLSDLQFKNAELKLDKMLFVKESPIGRIVSILGIDTPKFIVWFTPIYFSMQDGLIQMDRTDMLVADRYPLAAWGKVDVKKQDIDLTVALSGNSLKKAFGIVTIPDKGWLQIPIVGDIHHPKIDLASVTARLTSLAALSKAGSPGKLIGSVLEKAAELVGSDIVPKPTASPLPWQEELTSSDDQPNNINELKKGAKSLFKDLFSK